jgi:nitrate/nitrite-specific signal transduction histidine kinase
MRERAELLGGTIVFLRPREGGTLVRLTVPTAGADTIMIASDPVTDVH